MRRRDGLTRPACGGRGFRELRGRKVFRCNSCKRQVSPTAGTVFQDTKLPLTTWFSAIYHLTRGESGISPRSSSGGGRA
jgi:transposase-like protein